MNDPFRERQLPDRGRREVRSPPAPLGQEEGGPAPHRHRQVNNHHKNMFEFRVRQTDRQTLSDGDLR